MEITNSNYLWAAASALYTAPSVDLSQFSEETGASSFEDTMMDILNAVEAVEEDTNSLAYQMANLGAESLGNAPDFSSMTSEEFLEHLLELQQDLEESGADISDLVDPTTLTSEELEDLQVEMASRGEMPPPAPASDAISMVSMENLIAVMSLNMVDYSSYGESLFEYL